MPSLPAELTNTGVGRQLAEDACDVTTVALPRDTLHAYTDVVGTCCRIESCSHANGDIATAYRVRRKGIATNGCVASGNGVAGESTIAHRGVVTARGISRKRGNTGGSVAAAASIQKSA